MAKHQWVKYVVIPIDVVLDPTTGDAVVIEDEAKVAAAHETASRGCFACDEPLTEHTTTTECRGQGSAHGYYGED